MYWRWFTMVKSFLFFLSLKTEYVGHAYTTAVTAIKILNLPWVHLHKLEPTSQTPNFNGLNLSGP